MKRWRLLFIVLISIGFIACDKENQEDIGGREVTQQFLSEYNGNYTERTNRDDGGERLMIGRNGEIEVVKIRRVGEDHNPAIPSETVCSYILSGQIAYVVELNEQARQRVDSEGTVYYAPQTHNVVFQVHHVTLTDELHSQTTEDTCCQHFEKNMNAALPVYAYGVELFGDGVIRLHTTDNDDFIDGERADGTLDEVFERD